MNINSNINIIGGLPEFELINFFLINSDNEGKSHLEYSDIRTLKSVNRFKKAIQESFVSKTVEINDLFLPFLKEKRLF